MDRGRLPGCPFSSAVFRLDCVAGEKLPRAGDSEHLVREHDVVAFRERLHTSCKVHRLAEVVQAAVQRHREAGSRVRAALFSVISCIPGVGVEVGNPGVHVERGTKRVERIVEARHHRVADRLHERAGVP